MAVVCGHDIWTDVRTKWHDNIVVNWHGGKNTGGSDLDADGSNLIKDDVDNVLVVGHGSNCLNDEFSSSCNNSLVGSVVDMLVQDTVIAFMQTHGVGVQEWFTSSVGSDGVKVFDNTKTITAQTQTVTGGTETTITQIKGLLSMVWSSWVTVWHCHLRQRDSVSDGSALEGDVINGKTFSGVRGDSESPVLPFDQRTFDVKRWTFWALDNQWFQIFLWRNTVQVWVVFDSWNAFPWGGWGDSFVVTTWQVVDSDKLVGEGFENWSLVIGIVGTVHPWVISDVNPLWQLQFLDFCKDLWVLQTNLFDFTHVIWQQRTDHTLWQFLSDDNMAHADVDQGLVERSTILGVVVQEDDSWNERKWQA